MSILKPPEERQCSLVFFIKKLQPSDFIRNYLLLAFTSIEQEKLNNVTVHGFYEKNIKNLQLSIKQGTMLSIAKKDNIYDK